MAACDDVLNKAIADGIVHEDDRTICNLMMTRTLHMTADAGRPSDAMRSTVYSYQALGREGFLAAYRDKPF